VVEQGKSYPLRRELPIIIEVLFNGFVGESRTGKNFITVPRRDAMPLTAQAGFPR
jgi:hypothetical protein